MIEIEAQSQYNFLKMINYDGDEADDDDDDNNDNNDDDDDDDYHNNKHYQHCFH